MAKIRKFDFEAFMAEEPHRNLRQAARAYFLTAVRLYIKIEGRISVWDDERFGDSANIVCCLNRAIEHLLKLRLLKVDPLLLYPLPKKVEEYCRVRQIPTSVDEETTRRVQEREALAHTINFKESRARVELTYAARDYDFTLFGEIYSLRNSLEHHWDRNEEFLKKVVGQMSLRIIPQMSEFIEKVLGEDPKDYLPEDIILEVETLDRAFERGHSLAQQQRFEEHARRYKQNPEAARAKLQLSEEYSGLAEEETEVKCPVCQNEMVAMWDWEADYDVEGGEGYVSGAFPDVKALHCENCNYFVEGQSIEAYLPDGLDIEVDPAWYEC